MKSHGSQYFIWPIHCGKYLPKTYDFFQVLLNSLLVMKKLIELKKLRSMPKHFPFSIQLEIEILFVGTKVKYLSYCARVHSCYAHPCHAPAKDFSARR